MTDHTKLIARLEQEALNCERYAEEGERGDWDGIASLIREAVAALTADRPAEPTRLRCDEPDAHPPGSGVRVWGDVEQQRLAAEPTDGLLSDLDSVIAFALSNGDDQIEDAAVRVKIALAGGIDAILRAAGAAPLERKLKAVTARCSVCGAYCDDIQFEYE